MAFETDCRRVGRATPGLGHYREALTSLDVLRQGLGKGMEPPRVSGPKDLLQGSVSSGVSDGRKGPASQADLSGEKAQKPKSNHLADFVQST